MVGVPLADYRPSETPAGGGGGGREGAMAGQRKETRIPLRPSNGEAGESNSGPAS